jgi:phosphatidate cytidylyltransferase
VISLHLKVAGVLKQRIITAMVLAAVFIGVLLFCPPQVFALFAVIVSVVAAWEWANLCHLIQRRARLAYVGAMLVAATGLWLLMRNTALLSFQQLLFATCLWWAVALLWVQGYPSSVVFWQWRWVRMLMGLLVLVPCLLSLVYLRFSAGGQFMVIGVVLLVAAADIGAYFSGRALGRHKLAPRVSPGKSWEGVAGGLIAVAVLGLFYAFARGLDARVVLAIMLPAALVSVVGDLLESMLKRFRGIKDSGQLLPGHGGVLDRIDGLTAAVPVFTLAVITAERFW